VKAGVASYSSGILTLRDSQNAISGEYSFRITDISTWGNTRRQVQVDAYWPDQATAAAEYHATFYMRRHDGLWSMLCYYGT
jgi:hypothetical protein